jgi:hypothetical protein
VTLKLYSPLLIAVIILSACAQTTTPSYPPVPDAILASNVAVGVQPQANECLACHTEKDRLIETAKPEEVVEKESSGAG